MKRQKKKKKICKYYNTINMGNIQWVLFNLPILPIMDNMGKVLKLIPSNTIFVRQA